MAGLNPTLRFIQQRKEGHLKTEKVEGILLLPGLPASRILELREKLVIRPDDVFIATYPKCGTTWMQQIVKLIANNGVENGIDLDVFVPWIELMSLDEIESMSSPRFFKTHLPYQLMPGGGDPAKTDAKYIYIIRNPKDVAVSFYHFSRTEKTFVSFFEDFIVGNDQFGSIFSHYRQWWFSKESPNILILTYEQMKRNLCFVVAQVASFLGYSLSDDIISSVAQQTTFNKMKSNPSANKSSVDSATQRPNPFMRKGVIGDWKNTLSDEAVSQNRSCCSRTIGREWTCF